MEKYIKCGEMFDSETGNVLSNVIIKIHDNIIEEVSADPSMIKDDHSIIDLSDKFVMPGLMDCHTHIIGNGEKEVFNSAYVSIGDYALRGIRYAQKDLLAGFTTIRDMGAYGFSDIAVRNAINNGEFWGPRMFVSGSGIGTTGGHADSRFGPYIHYDLNDIFIFNGADEARRAARYNIKHGADQIKIIATGGVLSKGTNVGAQQITYDEARAIVEVAEMNHMATAVHAHGTEGIKTCVKAGVTSIEHGTLLDDECIELMAQKGTFLVPTFKASNTVIENGRELGVADWAIEKAKYVSEIQRNNISKCLKAGVKIAFGTDASTPCNYHGEQAYEFELMQRFGIPAVDTLISATFMAAKLLGKEDSLGSIKKGKLADIVAFNENPLEHVKTLANCTFVMKDGEVYKNE